MRFHYIPYKYQAPASEFKLHCPNRKEKDKVVWLKLAQGVLAYDVHGRKDTTVIDLSSNFLAKITKNTPNLDTESLSFDTHLESEITPVFIQNVVGVQYLDYAINDGGNLLATRSLDVRYSGIYACLVQNVYDSRLVEGLNETELFLVELTDVNRYYDARKFKLQIWLGGCILGLFCILVLLCRRRRKRLKKSLSKSKNSKLKVQTPTHTERLAETTRQILEEVSQDQNAAKVHPPLPVKRVEFDLPSWKFKDNDLLEIPREDLGRSNSSILNEINSRYYKSNQSFMDSQMHACRIYERRFRENLTLVLGERPGFF